MKFQGVLEWRQNTGLLSFAFPRELAQMARLKNFFKDAAKRNQTRFLVTLENPRSPRSTGERSQNHHLNGHIMQICEETGNDYASVKDAVKEIAVEKMGYPCKEIAGKRVPKRERECDTAECALLIEAAHIAAAFCGIILKEADE